MHQRCRQTWKLLDVYRLSSGQQGRFQLPDVASYLLPNSGHCTGEKLLYVLRYAQICVWANCCIVYKIWLRLWLSNGLLWCQFRWLCEDWEVGHTWTRQWKFTDWIYRTDPQISTSMQSVHDSWFTIVSLERWKVEKISRFDSQCNLYSHVDLALEIWSCSGLRHRAPIFHGQSVHWREGVDRRAWLEHYRLLMVFFCKARHCRAMTMMTSLHSMTMRCPWVFESLSWGYCRRECGQGRVWQLADGARFRSFFHPAMRLSTAVENPEGRGNSSQERCCRFLRWMSPTTWKLFQ